MAFAPADGRSTFTSEFAPNMVNSR